MNTNNTLKVGLLSIGLITSSATMAGMSVPNAPSDWVR
jgi:hypothetical protein